MLKFILDKVGNGGKYGYMHKKERVAGRCGKINQQGGLMEQGNVYVTETEKGVAEFTRDFDTVLQRYGFVISNPETMNMVETFSAHGADVGDGFDLHMIQICKPVKAAKSLAANPERAILMPKFVMVFTANGTTQVRYLSYAEADIKAVVDDAVFPASLAESYAKIRSMITEAV